MEDYHLFFVENPREFRLRFCRSALRAKELLFKSNDIEVGVIWSHTGDNKVKGSLHYSNTSHTAFMDFKTKIYSPRGIAMDVINLLPSSLYAS